MSESARPRVAVVGSCNTDLVVRVSRRCRARARPCSAATSSAYPAARAPTRRPPRARLGVERDAGRRCVGRRRGRRLAASTTLAARGRRRLARRSASRARPASALITRRRRRARTRSSSPRAPTRTSTWRTWTSSASTSCWPRWRWPADVVDELARRTSSTGAQRRAGRRDRAGRPGRLRGGDRQRGRGRRDRRRRARALRGHARGRGCDALLTCGSRSRARRGAAGRRRVDTVGAGDVFCAAYACAWPSRDAPAAALAFAVDGRRAGHPGPGRAGRPADDRGGAAVAGPSVADRHRPGRRRRGRDPARPGESRARRASRSRPSRGNVALDKTTLNARRLIDLARRPDVAVAAGCARSLRGLVTDEGVVHGDDGLGDLEWGEPAARRRRPAHAVDLLWRAGHGGVRSASWPSAR